MSERFVLSGGVADVLEGDEGVLVLMDADLHRLSLLGGATLRACERPATLAEIEDALVAQFGPPPDGEASELARAAVAGLVELGLLAVDA